MNESKPRQSVEIKTDTGQLAVDMEVNCIGMGRCRIEAINETGTRVLIVQTNGKTRDRGWFSVSQLSFKYTDGK